MDESLKLNLPGHRKVILKTVWSPLSMILEMPEKLKTFLSFICQFSCFGGLGEACWPLVPKFAGSNPAEAVGFLRAKKSFGGGK